MLTPLLQRVFGNFDPVLQGAAGSALFWLILAVLRALGKIALYSLNAAREAGRESKMREYIYRRFTSRSGLVNWLYGFNYTSMRALRGLLLGLMFCCIALLLGGSRPVIWGICFVAALVYFGSGLIWLLPNPVWSRDNLGDHWKRVAQLEQELLGKVQDDTNDLVNKYNSPSADSQSVKPNTAP